MVEPSQLQRLHFIDKRLFTPNMELSSLLLAILIQNIMHCRSGGRPIFRGHVAEYTVVIMRRKRTDVIDVGMICIPDAAKLSLLVLGWLLSIAEVPWFRGGLLDVFGSLELI
jgi:hypothetical protein